MSQKNNEFKILEFVLSDGLYSVSDIQDYFEYIFKKYEEMTENQSIEYA